MWSLHVWHVVFLYFLEQFCSILGVPWWISLQGLLEMLESKAMWPLTRQLSQGSSLWLIVPDTGWRWRWRRWADQEDWGEGRNGQARWQGGDKLIVQDELTNPEMHRRQRWQCRRLHTGLNAVQKNFRFGNAKSPPASARLRRDSRSFCSTALPAVYCVELDLNLNFVWILYGNCWHQFWDDTHPAMKLSEVNYGMNPHDGQGAKPLQDMTQSIRFSSNFVTCLMANVMHSSHVALKKYARTLASSRYFAWQVSALSWSCADRNGCMLGWDLLGSYRECGATFYTLKAEWNHPVSRVKSSLRDSGGAWNLELLAWFEGMKHCSNGFYDDFPVQNPRANWNVGAEVWTRTNEDDWRLYSFVIGLSMFVLLAME